LAEGCGLMKSAGLKLRIKALFIDYLSIILYLVALFAVTMGFYLLFFHGIPEFTEKQSQWIALLTTVLPVTVYFTIRESGEPFASFGKRKVGLKVVYLKNPIISSTIRNIMKFLPWQLAHMAVIRGIYNGFESHYVTIFYALSILLPIAYIVMVMIRKDHRHIPDLLAKSCIVVDESKHSV
jgi:uncharacterized RDD family membrane protein YckC